MRDRDHYDPSYEPDERQRGGRCFRVTVVPGVGAVDDGCRYHCCECGERTVGARSRFAMPGEDEDVPHVMCHACARKGSPR